MARPERFELPTTKFVAWYSIQLSYGRRAAHYLDAIRIRQHASVLLSGSSNHISLGALCSFETGYADANLQVLAE
jgi:hypothetical protein